ncbi:sigma-70 family RNA polymerase sigma factor [Kibdelosporangium philippinense]|uniref:Sigma-70 family RNA polymerase sigma factor n=2 Tax=Kibdelosporangium philippinense TaxID=211113 RepID=A0ABS8ZU49_9PSEU|nr:sigma-70 family RNA polymerase sigma factor [Kibdelosporangium philippinense]MCE7011270.1 sigma-70 family RNA polymerase sigma factor [Kibdelosporangium philippinense]
MDVRIKDLAVQAGSKDPQVRKTAGDRLVGMLRHGDGHADEAFAALCEAERPRIFHFFSFRVRDEQEAFDLTEKVIEKVLTAGKRLRLEYGVRSFYKYVYTVATRDVGHYLDKRKRSISVEPETFDMTDQWSSQPSPEELARSKEMYKWLRQAAAEIPDDLNLLMLAHGLGLPRTELIEVSGIPAAKFDRRLHAAKTKVIDRFVCLYLARTRGIGELETEKCATLAGELEAARPKWTPTQDFTTPVYMLVKRHLGRCEPCAAQYEDKKRRGLRPEFLGMPLIAMPDYARDQTTTAFKPVRPRIVRRRVPKSAQVMISTGVTAAAVAAAFLFTPAAPTRDASGSPAPTTTSSTPAASETTTSSAAPPTSTTTRPSTSTSKPQPSTRPSTPPVKPSTSATKPTSKVETTTSSAVQAPPQITLATSAATCAPADSCDPVPSCDTCSDTYVGSCTGGVTLQFKAIIKVNHGPAELKFRWVLNGTPMSSDTVSFPESGPQQTWVGQVTVLYASSGPWTAQLEVQTPQSKESNTPQATITCT